MTQKTILFVCYGGGHAQTLVPVLRALETHHPDIRAVVLGVTNGAVTLRQAGIAHLTYQDLMSPELAAGLSGAQRAKAIAHGTRLLAGNHNPSGGVSEAESIAYLGLNYLDLEHQHGPEAAGALYAQHGRARFLPLRSMAALLDKVQPDLVVTTPSPRTEQAARMVARQRGVPVLVVTDTPDPYNQNGFLNVICDTLCLPSQFGAQKWAEKDWVKADKYSVTGNPGLDRLVPYRGQRRDFAPAQPMLLFAQQTGEVTETKTKWYEFSQADLEAHFARWDNLCRRVQADGKVRLHPSLAASVFERWRSKTETVLALDTDPNVSRSLATASVLIGNFSSILTEALVIGTPVVQYTYQPHLRPLDGLLEQGATWPASFASVDSLQAATTAAIADSAENTRKFARFADMCPTVPSAGRVCDEILALL